MKTFVTESRLALALVFLSTGIILPTAALAATTPSLGVATTYALLSSTFTSPVGPTTINGDIGFTTPPAVKPLGGHPSATYPNYGSASPYALAGMDQGIALSNLASQPCTPALTFGSATDLSLLPQPLAPGVYCIDGAMSVGTGGITLTGSGSYIFRSTGALNTVANSFVTLSPGVSACEVFWTPVATTLGANSTFVGTVIDDSGITILDGTTWFGRALSFASTITTPNSGVTITAPVCTMRPATLHIIKNVVNDSGGTATSSEFILHVTRAGIDVLGSPAFGTSTPGTSYILSADSYSVSENATSSYSAVFSGDCDATGNIVLASGDNKTCIVTNTDISVLPPPVVSPPIVQTSSTSGRSGGRSSGSGNNIPAIFSTGGQVLGTSTSTTPVTTFPNTGLPPTAQNLSTVFLSVSTLFIILVLLLGITRKYHLT